MRTAKTIIKILLLAIMFLMVFITFTNCRSKKKTVERTAVSVARVEKNELIITAENLTIVDSAAVSKSTAIITSSNETVSAEIADPTKEAVLIKEDQGDGTTKWSGINLKKFSTGNSAQVTQKTDTASVKRSGQNLSKTKTNVVTEVKEEIDVSTKKKALEKNSFLGSWWLLLLIIALLYGAMSFYKKTENPLRWFS